MDIFKILVMGGALILDTQKMKDVIRHRYPFLLVDRILELDEGKRAIGIKNVTANEPFFNGHFPDYPVMPGVLIVEALAQVSAVIMLTKEGNQGRLGLLAGIDKCRFKKQVKPGDQIRLEVEIVRLKGPIGKGKGIATVDGELVCETELIFAFGD
jgi:3-hydroxyacyl-[acyl-carrier-protein] dehydratase